MAEWGRKEGGEEADKEEGKLGRTLTGPPRGGGPKWL